MARAVTCATKTPTSYLLKRSGTHLTPIRTGPEFVEVLRDPYEWKSAVRLALALFIASLALAPATTQDQKKLASEINTKTLKAAAAVKSSMR